MIPTDKIHDFFFMDDDEEQKEYGANPGAKMAAATLSANQMIKDQAKDKVGPPCLTAAGPQVQANSRLQGPRA